MLSQPYADLLRHMEWADALGWRAVLATPVAHEDLATRERLHHIHLVQQAFFAVWQHQPLQLTEAGSFPDLLALWTWAQPYYAALTRFTEILTEGALAEPVQLPWTAQVEQQLGPIHPVSLEQTLLQVAWHSSHHRGQVMARLRELGGEPPLTDYIAWLWQGRPAPVWASSAPA